MPSNPIHHPLGRIDMVRWEATPALSRDVRLALPIIQSAWPAFERSFDSLQGRKFMGLVFEREQTYRLCSTRLARDAHRSFGLDETSIPGGRYLRLRLVGEAPEIYSHIAEAFDVLGEHAAIDDQRPRIEFYRREGQIDCLMPVAAPALGETIAPGRPLGLILAHIAGIMAIAVDRLAGLHAGQQSASQLSTTPVDVAYMMVSPTCSVDVEPCVHA